MIDMDKINNADATLVAQAAYDTLDRIQDERKEMQLVALAAVFSVFCRRHHVDPSEVFRAATNVLATKYRDTPAFVSLDMYARHEF